MSIYLKEAFMVLSNYANKVQLNRTAIGFILLTFFAGLSVGVSRVATTLYALALNAESWQLGLVGSALSLGILLMGIPVGILLHRFSPARLFTVGSLFGAILFFATPLVKDIYYLLFCTLLVSFTLPLRFISLNTVFMQQMGTLGPAKAGWFRGLHLLGFFLLGPLVAVLLIKHVDYSGTFFLIAAIFMLSFFIAPTVLQKYGNKEKEVAHFNWLEVQDQLKLLVSEKDLKVTSLIEFFNHSVVGFFSLFIVVIAIKDYGLTKIDAANVLTLHGVTYIAALFLLGTVLQKIGRRLYYQISFSIVAFSLFVLAMHGAALWLWLASAILGLGLGMLHIVNFTAYANIGERLGMGRISGLSSLVGPTGGFLGSFLGGWFGHIWGLQSLFLPLAAIFVLLLVISGKFIEDAHQHAFQEILPELESEI